MPAPVEWRVSAVSGAKFRATHRRIAPLDVQGNLWTRRQVRSRPVDAARSGLAASTLRDMDDFVRLGHGLHRPAQTVEDLCDRICAYLDVLPAGTVVGGITAARLHNMWLPQPGPDERIEFILTRPGAHARELPGCRREEITTRRRALRNDEVVVTDRFPLLSPARTWVDLCEVLRLEDAVSAADSVLRGPVRREELEDAIQHARRRRGVIRARQALTLVDPRSRSRGETHLRCALVLGGLPWPEVNVAIYTEHGEWLAEPDLVYREARLALEYNGSDHGGVIRMRKDITRVLDVDRNDWKIVVFGPNEVFIHPYRIAPYVRGLLGRRDPHWRRSLAG
jgi:hypothetical protein